MPITQNDVWTFTSMTLFLLDKNNSIQQ